MLAETTARLVLEDGSVYEGRAIGAAGTSFGELVFNTSVTGYQEILTDPSYRGQVVLMTHTEIGNYGINREDAESARIHAAGFVVRRLSPVMSSWRGEVSLRDFLTHNGVVAIEGVDTRAITRRIRTAGAMKCGITTLNAPVEQLLDQVRNQPTLDEQDLVSQVTTTGPYTLSYTGGEAPLVDRVTVVDYGIKRSILDNLREFVGTTTVLPADTGFDAIRTTDPQGVLLSNGPGDPAVLTDAVATARQLVDSGIPTFGICLGHQILALACGADVHKMAFGHHGGNHPVKDLENGQITITSQNHGYAANFETFPADRLVVTHVNLNDGSIEGFRHKTAPVSSVQFHPEASPGPHDARYLFARFIEQARTHAHAVAN